MKPMKSYKAIYRQIDGIKHMLFNTFESAFEFLSEKEDKGQACGLRIIEIYGESEHVVWSKQPPHQKEVWLTKKLDLVMIEMEKFCEEYPELNKSTNEIIVREFRSYMERTFYIKTTTETKWDLA